MTDSRVIMTDLVVYDWLFKTDSRVIMTDLVVYD